MADQVELKVRLGLESIKNDVALGKKELEKLKTRLDLEFKTENVKAAIADIKSQLQKLQAEDLTLKVNIDKQNELLQTLGKLKNIEAKINLDTSEAKNQVNTLLEQIKQGFNEQIGRRLFDFLSQAPAGIAQTAIEFEKLKTTLRVTLGSQSEAARAFQQIQDFAIKTPFQVDEITQAYIQLLNRGLKPTTEQLTKLGDLASSQGRRLGDITRAILSASAGEFEPLRGFGVQASKQGDQIALTFKGVTTKVNNSIEGITSAIEKFGGLDGVLGGMAEQSKTLGGALSNLSDTGDKLKNAFGEGLLAPLNKLVVKFSESAGSAEELARKMGEGLGNAINFVADNANTLVGVLGGLLAVQALSVGFEKAAAAVKLFGDAQAVAAVKAQLLQGGLTLVAGAIAGVTATAFLEMTQATREADDQIIKIRRSFEELEATLGKVSTQAKQTKVDIEQIRQEDAGINAGDTLRSVAAFGIRGAGAIATLGITEFSGAGNAFSKAIEDTSFAQGKLNDLSIAYAKVLTEVDAKLNQTRATLLEVGGAEKATADQRSRALQVLTVSKNALESMRVVTEAEAKSKQLTIDALNQEIKALELVDQKRKEVLKNAEIADQKRLEQAKFNLSQDQEKAAYELRQKLEIENFKLRETNRRREQDLEAKFNKEQENIKARATEQLQEKQRTFEKSLQQEKEAFQKSQQAAQQAFQRQLNEEQKAFDEQRRKRDEAISKNFEGAKNLIGLESKPLSPQELQELQARRNISLLAERMPTNPQESQQELVNRAKYIARVNAITNEAERERVEFALAELQRVQQLKLAEEDKKADEERLRIKEEKEQAFREQLEQSSKEFEQQQQTAKINFEKTVLQPAKQALEDELNQRKLAFERGELFNLRLEILNKENAEKLKQEQALAQQKLNFRQQEIELERKWQAEKEARQAAFNARERAAEEAARARLANPINSAPTTGPFSQFLDRTANPQRSVPAVNSNLKQSTPSVSSSAGVTIANLYVQSQQPTTDAVRVVQSTTKASAKRGKI